MNVTLDKIKKRDKANDVVLTPRRLAKQHIDIVSNFLPDNLKSSAVWYDPFRYSENGSYYSQFPTKNKIWAEINDVPPRDFFEFTEGVDSVNVICSNPPYSVLEDVMRHSARIKPLIVSYLCSFNNFTARRLHIMEQAGYKLVYVRIHKKIKNFATGISAFFVWKLRAEMQNVIKINRSVWRCKAHVALKHWKSQQKGKQSTQVPIEDLASLQVRRTQQMLLSKGEKERSDTVWFDPFRNQEIGDLFSQFPTNSRNVYCNASFEYSREVLKLLRQENIPSQLRVQQQTIPAQNFFTLPAPASVDVVCGVLPKNLKQMYEASFTAVTASASKGKSAPQLDAMFEKIVGMNPSFISLMLVDYNITPQRLHYMNESGYRLVDCVMLKRYFSANMSFICIWQKSSDRKDAIHFSLENFTSLSIAEDARQSSNQQQDTISSTSVNNSFVQVKVEPSIHEQMMALQRQMEEFQKRLNQLKKDNATQEELRQDKLKKEGKPTYGSAQSATGDKRGRNLKGIIAQIQNLRF